jgi:hypothetical protein
MTNLHNLADKSELQKIELIDHLGMKGVAKTAAFQNFLDKAAIVLEGVPAEFSAPIKELLGDFSAFINEFEKASTTRMNEILADSPAPSSLN